MNGRKPQIELQPPAVLNMREVYLQAQKELAKPYPAIQLTEWPLWNQMTGGFRVREYSILCGPTGAGKTTLLANLSAQLLKQRVKHFVMSVETGHTDFMKRVMSALTGRDLNTGDPIPVKDLADIHVKHASHFESGCIEFSLYENRVPVEQLCHELRFMAEQGCKIAFIDNLNFFMEVTRAADAIVEMDRVTHNLIVLAKQIDMHIVMVMHPKKTDGGRIESEFEIKGSSTAVQEAHNVFLFNRPHPKLIADGERHPHQREVKIAKMRRRGANVGQSILFDNIGTQYLERGMA